MILLHLLLMLSGVGSTVEQSFETKTVAVGENVALTCHCGPLDTVFWIRPVSGKLPEVYKTFSSTSFDPRIRSTEESGAFVLRIINAVQRDTGVYYCVKIEHKNLTVLKGMDLKVQGSEPESTAVPPSDPVRPGDSVTLQCSVLSDSDDRTCPGGHSVCCYRDGSDVDPGFNYIQENSDGLSTKKCVYGFFWNVSSSDAATCDCAVDTCGEIFGNGTELDAEAVSMRANAIVFLLCAVLAFSLTLMAVLIYSRDICKGRQNPGGQQNQNLSNLSVYSAAVFTVMKKGSGGTGDAAEREKIYAAVKVLGLN